MLTVQNLTKKLPDGQLLLKDISFEIQKGEFVGILGESGVGKTILLRCINGLTSPDNGEIIINIHGQPQKISGKKGKELRKIQQNIGMIFQGSILIKRTSVLKNVLTGILGRISTIRSLFYGFTDEEVGIALKLLEEVGIKHLAYRRAETLSGGEMQRVAIARALLQEPYLLLADEPVANLDPKNTEMIMEYLQSLTREMAVICVLHSPRIAAEYCTRVIGIKDSVVIYDGGPDLPPSILKMIYSTEQS